VRPGTAPPGALEKRRTRPPLHRGAGPIAKGVKWRRGRQMSTARPMNGRAATSDD